MLLGDEAIERGSVIIGRDGHVELGSRHDHICGILNLIEERPGSFGFMRQSRHAKATWVVPSCRGDAPVQLRMPVGGENAAEWSKRKR